MTGPEHGNKLQLILYPISEPDDSYNFFEEMICTKWNRLLPSFHDYKSCMVRPTGRPAPKCNRHVIGDNFWPHQSI